MPDRKRKTGKKRKIKKLNILTRKNYVNIMYHMTKFL